MSIPDIQALFESGIHYGYSRTKRHPSMVPFIYGSKNRIDIIDIEKTQAQLKAACDIITTAKNGGKTILFVGAKPEVKNLVRDAALSIDMPYVENRWIGGTFTNFTEIKKRVDRMEDLETKEEKGELVYQTKKEKLMIEREIAKLKVMFGGLRNMKKLPDVVVVIDPRRESIAVEEANQMNIPVIGLANTDCDIRDIDFPIAGNDTNQSSVVMVLNTMIAAYKA